MTTLQEILSKEDFPINPEHEYLQFVSESYSGNTAQDDIAEAVKTAAGIDEYRK